MRMQPTLILTFGLLCAVDAPKTNAVASERVAQDVAKDSLPAALALVPSDAAAFVHIRVHALWNTELAKELRKQFPKLAADLDQATELPGKPLIKDVETLTFLLPKFPDPKTSEQPAVIILAMVEPIDRDKFLKEVLDSPEERKHKDKTYYVAKKEPGDAFHFAGDRTLIVGTEPMIQQVLAGSPADAKSELGSALRQAAHQHHVMAGVFGPEKFVATLLAEDVQRVVVAEAVIQDLLPLLKAPATVLTLDVGKEARADLHCHFASAEAAKQAVGGAQDALVLLRVLAVGSFIAGLRQEAAMIEDEKRKDFALLGMVLLKRLESGLRSAKVAQEGGDVAVSVRADLDSAALIAEVQAARKAGGRK